MMNDPFKGGYKNEPKEIDNNLQLRITNSGMLELSRLPHLDMESYYTLYLTRQSIADIIQYTMKHAIL